MVESILSLAALLVAIGSAVATWRLSRRQTFLQERLLSFESVRERDRKLDQRRAVLRASIDRSAPNRPKLFIGNEGQAEARAVRVRINGKPLSEADHVAGRGNAVTIIGAGAGAHYFVRTGFGLDPLIHVELNWEDDSSTPGSWQSQLRI